MERCNRLRQSPFTRATLAGAGAVFVCVWPFVATLTAAFVLAEAAAPLLAVATDPAAALASAEAPSSHATRR